ncbi:hypothetical protein HELRODRAFT_167078 [Helobdella robusta]|uniref:Uncharacterized protein n=1 Tax=Helobdella robusta TaxID=6412 RepID=T1EYZ7_HELRO|nr:hypothetical protein HELRODRAFT_167078 [Helobdella robusta]ESO10576.1 hypothetical protein HELRODRAFT_167078 [Helobdella robusta]
MSTSNIITELVNYSRSTSVRGVPKFVNSKDKVLKALWMACVLICFSILIFLLVNSFQKFYSWSVMTQSGELVRLHLCSLKRIGGTITFPDVTICNIDPFGAAYPASLPIDTYLNFIDTYRPNFKNIFMDEYKIDASEERTMYNDLYSIPAYIQNLPKYDELENAECPHFIVNCDIFMLNWINSELNCTQRTKHFKFWDQNYYTCYTISTSKINSFPNITVRGLFLVLNVGPTHFNQLKQFHTRRLS